VTQWPNTWQAALKNDPSAGKMRPAIVHRSLPVDHTDVFAEAVKSADAGEGPYIEAAKPFLTAVANREHDKAYSELSKHALAGALPQQFISGSDKPADKIPIKNLTAPQWADWLKKMEGQLGVPEAVDLVYVDSIDARELAGAVPKEVAATVKARVRAHIRTQLPAEQVTKIAKDLKISEDQVRLGKWPENEFGYDPTERPFFVVTFSLVDEEGKLKVGHFEFREATAWDD
jgi:hypothetical protein